MESKVCIKCNINKPATEFYVNKKTGRTNSYCKSCAIEYSKNYQREHYPLLRLYHKEKNKEYAIKHPNYHIEYQKTYIEPESSKNKRRESIRKRNSTHPDYPVLNKIYIRIWQFFKRNAFSKQSEQLFSCSKEQLTKYIQSVFIDKMSFENYGTVWKMGHKKPPSKFNLQTDDGVKKFAHYKNLLPILIKNFNKKDI